MLDQAFNQYISTTTPPLDITVPPDILEIYDAIHALEERSGRTCQGGFFYGGLFPSLLRNKAPRDIDIAVHAPEIVEQYRLFQTLNEKPYGSYRAMEDSVEQLGGLQHKIFTSSPNLFYTNERASYVKEHPAMGGYFAMTAYYETPKASRQLDILFTERRLDPQAFFAGYNNGPVSQIAFDVEQQEYIYHRDFPAHATDWVFQPDSMRPVPEDALTAARRKGMDIIMGEPAYAGS